MINIEKIKQNKTTKELLEFGILNIDKPSGPTSFQVDEILKKKLELKKTSHFGTLDPKVTGVLPIALNRACKLLRWFMRGKKTYIGIMKLHKKISEDELKKQMKKFVGKIIQIPPVKSRVKRQERERNVYSWKILEFDKEKKEVLFEIEVEAGTYIRKLIHDLGLKIGGAHMSELRRTKAGIFSENDKNFVNLYGLEKAIKGYVEGKENKLRELIIPSEIISKLLPIIEVKNEVVKKLLTGKPIYKQDLVKENKIKGKDVAVFSNLRFIGVYKLLNKKDIIAKPEFVFN